MIAPKGEIRSHEPNGNEERWQEHCACTESMRIIAECFFLLFVSHGGKCGVVTDIDRLYLAASVTGRREDDL